ncbi:hypothetical protein QUF54_02535, partial [Candidatus Marithioploca araucensis]|nr:hypothetical protein [Candidatus Marithioploca araucensis]
HFALSVFFNNVNDTTPLNIINVKERVIFQRDDGKGMEIDVVAESKCGRFVLVEVRKTKTKMGLKTVSDFQEKVAWSSFLYLFDFTGFFIIRWVY